MSKNAENHVAECDANWKHQDTTNARHEAQLSEIFRRLNRLEVRFAAFAAIGGFVGSLLSKLIP